MQVDNISSEELCIGYLNYINVLTNNIAGGSMCSSEPLSKALTSFLLGFKVCL